MKRARLSFLGTGASSGVPVLTCSCSVCLSSAKENKRTRTSAFLELGEQNFLIDASPDFRSQALRASIKKVDGLILTHTHYDHSGGLDDLRIFFFKQKKALPCLLSRDSYRELEKARYYFFEKRGEKDSITAQFAWQILEEDEGRSTFLSEDFRYLSYYQAGMRVLGFRHANFAYLTDIRDYDESIFAALEGVSTLVLSALRYTPSHMHFSVDEALNFAEKLAPRRLFLSHLSHEIDYHQLNEELPSNVQLAYDGLVIDLTEDL